MRVRRALLLPLALLVIGGKYAPGQEAARAEQTKPAEIAPSPVPAPEANLSGSMDVGYRWRSDVRGNFNSYRSVVNLGEGPKLTGLDFTLQDPKKRLFDRLDARGYAWGGDPYNTAHLGARKLGIYDFSFDYRNIAYFNFLPSFADPTIERGILLDQRSFDIQRRLSDFELELFPGKRIVPYLAYNRDSGFGRGITTFVGDVNEYPVSDRLRDQTNHYRGGVRLEFNRFHLTLEQGGTTFKDDQRVFTSDRNLGNRTTPFFGQQLFLASLDQAYGVRGKSIYSKALFNASPVSWADLSGQFLYSQPKSDARYSQANTGLFAVASALLFFNGQQDLLSAEARQPHTSGSFGAELRPMRRLRIIESWLTDRLHNASLGLLTSQLLLPASQTQTQSFPLSDRRVLNYNQQQVEALFDVTSRLTLRGGHRYVWGDAKIAPTPLTPAGDLGELRQQIGLAGLSFRTSQKLSFHADFAGGSSDRTYFRTSLHNYQKVRARARYQASAGLTFTADFSLLNNHNPSPTINYAFLSRDHSFSVFWTPGGGKRISVSGDYTRSSLRSDILYLVPQALNQRERSFYRDNAHTGSAVVDLGLPRYSGPAPRIAFGGAFFVSSGSRPSRYYQPLARLSLPLHKYVYWNSEWRWYGFGERFYLYEDFRAHLLMTGLRLTK